MAWAFAIERENALEIEELYVRPEFRGRGYGRLLTERMTELAKAKRQSIRLWVPFADCKTERPTNYLPLVAIARRLGLTFLPCPVQWAAYLATSHGAGSELPIEPKIVPPRPRCPRAAIIAAALALGVGTNGTNGHLEKAPTVMAYECVPAINSPEWDAMNERRAKLIRKDIDHGLTAAEREEYERLQKLSLAAVAQAFPYPKPDSEGLARLREDLRSASSRRKE